MSANVWRQFDKVLTRPLNWRSLFLVLLLGCGTAISAQQSPEQGRESLNYGFVSPNTRDDLKIEEAIRGMNSPEEARLLKEVTHLACVVRSKIRAVRALGSWSDGAEHSVMLRVKADEAAVRYLLARMGRDSHQKSVLYFHLQPAGAATIYILRPRQPVRNLVAIANILERAGVAFRTLVPVRRGTLVYIVDLKRELHAKVMTAAKRLRARVSSQTGNAGFIGDEAVQEKANSAFEREIKEYETKNPRLPSACRELPH